MRRHASAGTPISAWWNASGTSTPMLPAAAPNARIANRSVSTSKPSMSKITASIGRVSSKVSPMCLHLRCRILFVFGAVRPHRVPRERLSRARADGGEQPVPPQFRHRPDQFGPQGVVARQVGAEHVPHRQEGGDQARVVVPGDAAAT